MADDITAVTHLIARIAQAMDSAPEVEDLLDLVTTDIEWAPPGTEPLRGRQAFRDWVVARRESRNQGPDSGLRHLVSSVVVDLDEHRRVGRVRAHFAMVATGADGAVVRAIGSYEDEVINIDGSWLLRRRLIRL